MKKPQKVDPEFSNYDIKSQNEILSKNLKTHQQTEREKQSKVFSKTKGKKQMYLTFGWMFPTEQVFLDRQYLTKNQKDKKLEFFLSNLRKEYFTVVDNENEIFEINELPLLVMGNPSFTYLNIMNKKKNISMQVNSKVGAYIDRNYFELILKEEITQQTKKRTCFSLNQEILDFENGSMSNNQGKFLKKIIFRKQEHESRCLKRKHHFPFPHKQTPVHFNR